MKTFLKLSKSLLLIAIQKKTPLCEELTPYDPKDLGLPACPSLFFAEDGNASFSFLLRYTHPSTYGHPIYRHAQAYLPFQNIALIQKTYNTFVKFYPNITHEY
ncbi:MAG: hypothetical protein COZ46_03220 [Verrucomicrobia bacterium CG_4_10_14_3_um_filter_43_23]|nr:MAG: hypothetical protein AUJ82_00645 [Verrucomicrobia bacterium CG1_02_43_26]PIP59220.1 MAG: hypothetical protein COX01_04290 [Verrucomicrobia bacterium CG22_combo_CG10-13_8_21_14_all_43_17]PIX58596.1 MAG: hypothetical protein COZ46_03220 [Verrucomicrobia bacterium CG_4_10_14_3_um_filter_43_23]PIY61048.1 MAG: hypothetical protein COY94_07540 [Verrucomicrobia bacterium CG_4_10_14_0_8_um_filter_43_34]PJA43889.1 MAG: hypothetical protein CO175_05910 [Verrucomicrobia bacterium CG_4_9_14_3_um_fi